MAEIRSTITSDFSKIYLISDDINTNTLYPVLQIYKNNVLEYTTAVGGTSTINGVVYTTDTGVTNLNFVSTVTTLGTEYLVTITPAFLGLTEDKIPEGVYTLKLLDASFTTDIILGVISYAELNCCMAKKLNDAYKSSMPDYMTKAEEEVIKVSTLLKSAEASVEIKDMVNAVKKFTIASLICKDCGCK